MSTGRIRGAEALLRLNDGKDPVSPSVFFPIIERTELSTEVDQWVIAEALRVLAHLQTIDPMFVLTANVSGPSVCQGEYLRALNHAVDQYPQIPAGTLVLEITETTAVEDLEQAREFTRAVRERGLLIALDDFGTGFGSFAYMKNLLFDFIKIDGDFVAELPHSPTDRGIVQAMVQAAHDLGKRSIAEHVSSDELLCAVSAMGIEYAQGYAIGRPSPMAQFIEAHLLKETA